MVLGLMAATVSIASILGRPTAAYSFVPMASSVSSSASKDPRGTVGATFEQDREQLEKILSELTLYDSQGNTFRFAEQQGQPILLDLWATWCIPCRQELPLVDRISRLTRGTGLRLIGLDEDNNAEAAIAFMQRNGYTWPDYHEDPHLLQVPHSEIPQVLIIDQKGKIAYQQTGPGDGVGLIDAIKRLGPQYSAIFDPKRK